MSAVVNNYDGQIFWIITVCGIYTSLIPTIAKMIVSLFNYESERHGNLRKQIKELKSELGGISMMNEFAKYAKIQRKISRMSDELSSQSNVKMLFRIKLRVLVYSVLYAVNAAMMMYLMWYHRSKPLVILPSNLMHPFSTLLSFPTGVEGALGITPWLFMVTYIGKRVGSSFA